MSEYSLEIQLEPQTYDVVLSCPNLTVGVSPADLELKMDKDPADVTADTLTDASIFQFFKNGIKKITALGLYQWLKGKFDNVYSTFSGAHNDLSGKNSNPDYQHITQAERDAIGTGGGGGGGFTQQTLTDEATISWNAADGNWGIVEIDGDRTIGNPTNLTVGQELILEIKQGTGGGHTMLYGSNFTFAGGIEPILSSGEGDIDRLRFVVRSLTNISFESANFDV